MMESMIESMIESKIVYPVIRSTLETFKWNAANRHTAALPDSLAWKVNKVDLARKRLVSTIDA